MRTVMNVRLINAESNFSFWFSCWDNELSTLSANISFLITSCPFSLIPCRGSLRTMAWPIYHSRVQKSTTYYFLIARKFKIQVIYIYLNAKITHIISYDIFQPYSDIFQPIIWHFPAHHVTWNLPENTGITVYTYNSQGNLDKESEK